MTEKLLNGNFKVKREVSEQKQSEELTSSQRIARELKARALSTLGGSMVYVDRTGLEWDGAAEDGK